MKHTLVFIALGISLLQNLHAKPTKTPVNRIGATKYLYQFGYAINDEFDDAPEKVTDEDFSTSLKSMQTFAGLEATGKLDAPTIELIQTPRCGIKDVLVKVKRSKRYLKQGSVWRKNKLTWKLINSGSSLSYETVEKIFEKATQYWSAKTNIDFEKTSGDPDIEVKFAAGPHGDPYPFDGPGGTLAHAFYPLNNEGLSGDVHFDDHETFVTDVNQAGRDLLWVATHEIGHSLGLAHSDMREALMYPWYSARPDFQLHEDDILGIQSLYGGRVRPLPTTTTTTATTTQKVKPLSCLPSKVTALFPYGKHTIALTEGGDLCAFLNGRFRGCAQLSKYFGDLTVDAVLTTDKLKDRTVDIVFSGTSYYVYNSFRRESGPHSIHDANGPLNMRFPTSVKKVDAAIMWERNGKAYLFAGREYWRYDFDAQKPDVGYPQRINPRWKGLPDTIDAAFSTADETFFMKDNEYYAYDNYNVLVKPGYPKDPTEVWPSCKQSDVGSLMVLDLGVELN